MQRRNVLKRVGQGAALGLCTHAASTPATARRANGYRNGVDLRFDPTDDRDLRSFFNSLQGLSSEQRRDVQSSLDERRAHSVTDVLRNVDVQVERRNEPEPDMGRRSRPLSGLWGYQRARVVGAVSARHWLFRYTLWQFHYEIRWRYNFARVRNIARKPAGRTYDATWSFDGLVNGGSWDVVETGRFESRRQGRFSYIGGGYIPTFEYTPWIRLRGLRIGFGYVVNAGRGG